MLLEQRDPLYREAAHIVVDTGSQSAASLASRVLSALGEHDESSRQAP
jgi:shikimate kinase